MRSTANNHTPKLVEYDSVRRRLWILGQRCHHGATGALVAAFAVSAIATERHVTVPMTTLIASGAALMAHDWKDRFIWFEPGYQNQP